MCHRPSQSSDSNRLGPAGLVGHARRPLAVNARGEGNGEANRNRSGRPVERAVDPPVLLGWN